MKVVVFPGQGSQYINMGKDIYESFSIAKDIFKKAEDICSLPIINSIFNDLSEGLNSTKINQVAIMVTSIALLRVLEEVSEKKLKDFTSYLAGHSLGEYTALVASGALEFENAVNLLKIRGQAMENACKEGGAMLAIIGINDINIIKEIVTKSKTDNLICDIANDNANGQIILSGHKVALDNVAKIAKEEYKAKLVKFLNVSGPFHSSLMQEAVLVLKESLDKIAFKNMQIPVISNVTAKPILTSENIKELLLQQIVKPVRWRESILYLSNLGVTSLIEVGPGKVLTGLAKRIDNTLKCVNIENINDIKNFAI